MRNMHNSTSRFQRDITSGLLVKNILKLFKDRYEEDRVRRGVTVKKKFSLTPVGPIPMESIQAIDREGLVDLGEGPNCNRIVLNPWRKDKHFRDGKKTYLVMPDFAGPKWKPPYIGDSAEFSQTTSIDPFPQVISPPFGSQEKTKQEMMEQLVDREIGIPFLNKRMKTKYICTSEPECESSDFTNSPITPSRS